jgi:hypothetical protein
MGPHSFLKKQWISPIIPQKLTLVKLFPKKVTGEIDKFCA